MSRSSIADVAGASLSHPDTAGLMGATMRAPIASSPTMLGSIYRRRVKLGADADIGTGFGTEARAPRFSPLSHYSARTTVLSPTR